MVGARADDVTVRADPQAVVGPISPDFVGLGYEASAVAQTNYFGGGNATLIQLYRNLGAGLIRIGGLASDNTAYEPDGVAVARSFRQLSVLNRTSLANLGDFARATGWKVMWGLNLGHGSSAQAADEAVAVQAALGDRLQSFQIGNEVEGLGRFHHNFDAYHAAYLEYKAAVRAKLPQAPFSGPDSVGNWKWITSFVDAEKGDLKLITQHYYVRDAHDPNATLERMLAPDPHWQQRLTDLQQLAQTAQVPYRINEVNSFSGGGKAGVSDTFGSALWCLDYMFVAAAHGCNGVNMQTDFNHLAWISHYSPIVHDPTGLCHARSEYYGMLAFSLAGKGNLVRSGTDAGALNLTAYAVRDPAGNLWVTVINKDLARDASVHVEVGGLSGATGDLFRLQAPSVQSTDHVTLAGAEVAADGTWKAGAPESVAVQAGRADISVPHASAVLLREHL